MPNHIFCDGHVVVDLAIVYLELEADKVGEDGRGSGLGPNGRNLLSCLGTDDRETVTGQLVGSGGISTGSRCCFLTGRCVVLVDDIVSNARR